MSNERLARLDRLYARHPWGEHHRYVPEAWSPPWQPRGRWWMRATISRTWQSSAWATMHAWRRLTRPSRAC
jgi:hypothetical protein